MSARELEWQWLLAVIAWGTSARASPLLAGPTPAAQKVSAAFLLAGWTKGDAPRHVVSVVPGDGLEQAKARLSPITALHLYSLAPVATALVRRRAPLKAGWRGESGCQRHG